MYKCIADANLGCVVDIGLIIGIYLRRLVK